MKKIISMVFLIVGFSTVYSQIGINTPNPQQAFHLDGKKIILKQGFPMLIRLQTIS